MHFLIVGLGNPGKSYEKTRHNMGFMVVSAFAKSMGWVFRNEKRFFGYVAMGIIGENNVGLLLPKTYMNDSGKSVHKYACFFKLPLEQILVVVDDVSIGFGDMRLRIEGGTGGHNGLKSIEGYLGTCNYSRLRMGVGNDIGYDLTDYVLGCFLPEEKRKLNDFIACGVEAVNCWLHEDIERVMNKINIKRFWHGNADIKKSSTL